jgi:serine/threonine-protein kinase RsbW
MVTMSEQPCLWRYDRSIRSDSESVRQVLKDVLDQLELQHWPQRDIFSVHLAMEEALVNAMRHGNHLDSAKHVRVCCMLFTDRVCIEIADEGAGFDPASLPDPTCGDHIQSPCGRGVMLMRAFMSRVEYTPPGNCVILEKDRSTDDSDD